MPSLTAGSLKLIGEARLRPRGSLSISGPRELLAIRSIRGAFDPDGTCVKDTLRITGTRARVPDIVPDMMPNQEIVDVCEEEVVWGGCIVSQFGHFLTESVSRLWPLLPGAELSGLPVVFTTPSGRGHVGDWLKAFGVRVITLPAKGAVRFTRAFIPEPAWRLNAWVTPEIRDIHLHAREGLDVRSTSRHNLLWLSRSKLNRGRRAYDENLLEWILRDHARIIHPEAMTLAEQVAAIEASDAVAGIIGSAFHSLLLASDPPECLYLCPGKVMSAYVGQNELLKVPTTFVHALAASKMSLLEKFRVPDMFRLSIPESLRALNATVRPGLLDDPRIALFASPEICQGSDARAIMGDLEQAIVKVLLDPLWIRARMDLGATLESQGLSECALEQFIMVANLNEDYLPAPLRAARLMARRGESEEASEMAGRVLAIKPKSKREEMYAREAERYIIDGVA